MLGGLDGMVCQCVMIWQVFYVGIMMVCFCSMYIMTENMLDE